MKNQAYHWTGIWILQHNSWEKSFWAYPIELTIVPRFFKRIVCLENKSVKSVDPSAENKYKNQ